MPVRRRNGGLTLIELMVGVAVMALLATLAAPSFEAYLQRRRVEGLSAQFLADWQWARSVAIVRNEPVRLSLFSASTDSGGCYVLHSGAAGACRCTGAVPACNAGVTLLGAHSLPLGHPVRLRANITGLLIDPRQGTVSPAGSIELLAANGDGLRHVVNLLGRTRVCAAAGTWPGVPAC